MNLFIPDSRQPPSLQTGLFSQRTESKLTNRYIDKQKQQLSKSTQHRFLTSSDNNFALLFKSQESGKRSKQSLSTRHLTSGDFHSRFNSRAKSRQHPAFSDRHMHFVDPRATREQHMREEWNKTLESTKKKVGLLKNMGVGRSHVVLNEASAEVITCRRPPMGQMIER